MLSSNSYSQENNKHDFNYRLLGPGVSYHNNKNGQMIEVESIINNDAAITDNNSIIGSSTKRYEKNKGYNSFHPAIGLEYMFNHEKKLSLYSMIVVDSYNKNGFMLGVSKKYDLTEDIQAGFVAGAWYRSRLENQNRDLKMGVIPFVMPTLRYNFKDWSLDLTVAPKFKNYNPTTTTILQVTYKIN